MSAPLKITLFVDPELGEQFMGLLGKALGRREMGLIRDIRIEATAEIEHHHEARRQPKLVAKVAAAMIAPKPPKPRRGTSRRQVDVERGMAKVVLDALKQDAVLGRPRIVRALEAHGFKGASANGLIDRLKKAGIIYYDGTGYALVKETGDRK